MGSSTPRTTHTSFLGRFWRGINPAPLTLASVLQEPETLEQAHPRLDSYRSVSSTSSESDNTPPPVVRTSSSDLSKLADAAHAPNSTYFSTGPPSTSAEIETTPALTTDQSSTPDSDGQARVDPFHTVGHVPPIGDEARPAQFHHLGAWQDPEIDPVQQLATNTFPDMPIELEEGGHDNSSEYQTALTELRIDKMLNNSGSLLREDALSARLQMPTSEDVHSDSKDRISEFDPDADTDMRYLNSVSEL